MLQEEDADDALGDVAKAARENEMNGGMSGGVFCREIRGGTLGGPAI